MTEQKQNKVLEQIKSEYEVKSPDKIDEVKKLNDKVHTPPTVLAYILGIISTLVLGVGMCICLGVIAKDMLAVGIVVGVIGIIMMIANVFIYKAFLKARKNKYGKEILSKIGTINE